MMLILGSFRVDPARLEEMRPAMEAMIAESRIEPGCIEYSYAEDMVDAGLIHITQRWRSRDALAGHFTAPHRVEICAEWTRLGVRDRVMTLYDCAEGEAL